MEGILNGILLVISTSFLWASIGAVIVSFRNRIYYGVFLAVVFLIFSVFALPPRLTSSISSVYPYAIPAAFSFFHLYRWFHQKYGGGLENYLTIRRIFFWWQQ